MLRELGEVFPVCINGTSVTVCGLPLPISPPFKESGQLFVAAACALAQVNADYTSSFSNVSSFLLCFAVDRRHVAICSIAISVSDQVQHYPNPVITFCANNCLRGTSVLMHVLRMRWRPAL
jgi:hypothetical protein